MKVTREQKYKVCHKHHNLLKVIEWLKTDGVILQDQLQQILTSTGLYKANTRVVEALRQLEEAEVIKKVRQEDYRSQFILFEKFAWQYVLGKTNSQEVRATKKKSLNQYAEIIYKTQLVIELYITPVTDFNLLQEQIGYDKTTIIYNRGQALEWFETHKQDFSGTEFVKQLQALQEVRNQALINLRKKEPPQTEEVSVEIAEGVVIEPVDEQPSKKPSKKTLDFMNLTLDSLMKRNIHIQKFSENKIEFVCYDLNNVQSIKTIATNYYICHRWARETFEIEDIELNICVIHGRAATNVNRLIKERGLNTQTKQIAERTPVQAELMRNQYVNFNSTCVEDVPKHINTFDLNIRKYIR